MKKSAATLAAVFTLSLLPAVMRAQTAPNPAVTQVEHFYHVHFAVEEVNASGQVSNSRGFQETIATTAAGHGVGEQVIKTGSRVPISTGVVNGAAQFTYIDLGVELRVRDAGEHGNTLSFRLSAVVSSIARQTEIQGTSEPVIRQNTWDSIVMVPVGKPTVVLSSDDLDSKGRLQVEVTATPIE